ncbi:MAG: isoprenylcysteine carboxylmethyltransferase family protein [Anaerolineaceae bacterium]|nr:isoprenylcysteine carboxylmethyltransferase family protein [Anaerolineaceae bacterium]
MAENSSASIDRKLIRVWLAKQIFPLIRNGLLLFLGAWTLRWTYGWLQYGFYALVILIQIAVFMRYRPALAVERAKVGEGTPKWDLVLVILAALVLPMFLWLVAGFDYRFQWTPTIPLWARIVCTIGWLAGDLITVHALWVNPFFSGTVRVQDDRGQYVIKEGLYGRVRHPGYLGMVYFYLFLPPALGSLWALIPAFLAVVCLAVRIPKEEQVLREGLAGYENYTRDVPWRLFPHIW